MPSFFIDRPVFAWVVAIAITLAGAISLTMLPIAQYPTVAPPQIKISANYPGASPEDTYEGVTRLIEDELNGIPGLLYYESTSDASGAINITVTFKPGSSPETSAVEVQNRVRRVESRLPSSVSHQAVNVEAAGGGTLLLVALTSKSGDTDGISLGDYMSRNVANELRRVPGVANAQLFGSERAMRVWLAAALVVAAQMVASLVIDVVQRGTPIGLLGLAGAFLIVVGVALQAGLGHDFLTRRSRNRDDVSA